MALGIAVLGVLAPAAQAMPVDMGPSSVGTPQVKVTPYSDNGYVSTSPPQIVTRGHAAVSTPATAKGGQLDAWATNAFARTKYDAVSPNDRAQLPSHPTSDVGVTASATSDNGFSWGDAGIGAGSAAAFLVILLGGSIFFLRRKDHGQLTPA